MEAATAPLLGMAQFVIHLLGVCVAVWVLWIALLTVQYYVTRFFARRALRQWIRMVVRQANSRTVWGIRDRDMFTRFMTQQGCEDIPWPDNADAP